MDNNVEKMDYSQSSDANKIIQGENENQGNLFLGNITSAKDIQFLQNNNIKFVLSLINTSSAPKYKKKQEQQQEEIMDEIYDHLVISVEDVEDTNLLPYFQECHDFIQKNLEIANVLVHCMAGVSRSATIVISYIMKMQNISYRDAYSIVRKNRYTIGPNHGFVNQLREYDYNLFQK